MDPTTASGQKAPVLKINCATSSISSATVPCVDF